MKKLFLILSVLPVLFFSEDKLKMKKEGANKEIEKKESIFVSDPYVFVGVGPIPLPGINLGGGYRLQKNMHGFDVKLSTMPRIYYKGALKYLVFPKPSLKKEYYFGLGGAYTYVEQSFIYKAPSPQVFSSELVLGKRYTTKNNNKRFLELCFAIPHTVRYKKDKSYYDYNTSTWIDDETTKYKVSYMPFITLDYGWIF